jgi:hypothetical protein
MSLFHEYRFSFEITGANAPVLIVADLKSVYDDVWVNGTMSQTHKINWNAA